MMGTGSFECRTTASTATATCAESSEHVAHLRIRDGTVESARHRTTDVSFEPAQHREPELLRLVILNGQLEIIKRLEPSLTDRTYPNRWMCCLRVIRPEDPCAREVRQDDVDGVVPVRQHQEYDSHCTDEPREPVENIETSR